MFRTARRVTAALALVPFVVALATGAAHAEASVPAISDITISKVMDTASNTYTGATTVNSGTLVINSSLASAKVIVFTGLEAAPVREDDGSTSYTWEFKNVLVTQVAAPTLTKVGSGTLVLDNGAAATVRVNNLANLEALLNTTRAGQDLVLTAPVDPAAIGLLLPAIQKAR